MNDWSLYSFCFHKKFLASNFSEIWLLKLTRCESWVEEHKMFESRIASENCHPIMAYWHQYAIRWYQIKEKKELIKRIKERSRSLYESQNHIDMIYIYI